jgi:hypothetical protein
MTDLSRFRNGWTYVANVVDEDGDVICDGHFYRYVGRGLFERDADQAVVHANQADFIAAFSVASSSGRLQ